MNVPIRCDDIRTQETNERDRLVKLVHDLYQQKEQAIQDAKQLAKALESIQSKKTLNPSPYLLSLSAFHVSPKIFSILAHSDVIVIDFEQSCQAQVGKVLLPQVVFHSNFVLEDMEWKWLVSDDDDQNDRLVSTDCFYIPNPDDVNQNLKVKWTRKIENDYIMQSYELGKIRLSSDVENWLMSFELMGRAIFTGLRNLRGQHFTMFVEKEYISITHSLENNFYSNFHFSMKEIRIDCLAPSPSSFGFCINSKYEFFVETRMELILIYCTIHMFALSTDTWGEDLDSTRQYIGEQVPQDKNCKHTTMKTNNFFIKRFPFARRKVQDKHDSAITYKPMMQISRPIPESVWHAKEDWPRQPL